MSVTVKVAVLFASPGGVPAVNWIPKKQEVPAATEAVLVVSKLQLGGKVGATKLKFAALGPGVPITALVILSVPVPAF